LPSACGWCHQPPQGTRTPELLVMSRAHQPARLALHGARSQSRASATTVSGRRRSRSAWRKQSPPWPGVRLPLRRNAVVSGRMLAFPPRRKRDALGAGAPRVLLSREPDSEEIARSPPLAPGTRAVCGAWRHYVTLGSFVSLAR
jgi:hypothetical protein